MTPAVWATESRKEWEGHAGPVLDCVGTFDVISCEACGFRHVVPIPSEKELAQRYRNEYYSVDRPLYIQRTIEDLDWWNLAYSDRFDDLEMHLPAPRRRILDIGSGPGYFLLHGKARGWTVVGIEPSVQAYAHSVSLGLEVRNEFLTDENAASLGTFDAIHMSEVLEHLPDPRAMLRRAWRMLEPEGLLYISLPNDYSPFQLALKTCGYSPWWVAPPHHINYFDRASLSATLECYGFEVVKVDATFPIDAFLLMGINYVNDDTVGRRCHAWRKTFELNLARAGLNALKRELYQRAGELGIGRELLMIGRKPRPAR